MLIITEQELKSEARNRGYRPEILEKVYRLLDLITQFMSVPYLKNRLALKGGTAINLFCTDQLPRLPVDLDFNYIGAIDREVMREEKIELEKMMIDICSRRKYELKRNPRAHAGGKMIFAYQSAIGNKGRLEIDMNYIFRIPSWV
jgi:predicted nucleotidyltransferase component of viral defense system